MSTVLPLEYFAAMVFSGFMVLYMVTGALYALYSGDAFCYTIPFAFVLQGVVLSLLIAVVWALLFNERLDKKTRWFPRCVIFAAALMVLLTVCLLVFAVVPTEWAKLWLFSAGGICAGIVVLSVLGELYLKAKGKRYTKVLEEYQANRAKH